MQSALQACPAMSAFQLLERSYLRQTSGLYSVSTLRPQILEHAKPEVDSRDPSFMNMCLAVMTRHGLPELDTNRSSCSPLDLTSRRTQLQLGPLKSYRSLWHKTVAYWEPYRYDVDLVYHWDTRCVGRTVQLKGEVGNPYGNAKCANKIFAKESSTSRNRGFHPTPHHQTCVRC